MDIITDIKWKHKKDIVLFTDGTISLNEGKIIVQGKVSIDGADKISAANPAYIDICEDFREHITYKNSHIGEISIDIDLSGSIVLCVNMGRSIENEFCNVSFELSSIKYTYDSAKPESKCLFAVPSIFFENHFRRIEFGNYDSQYKVLNEKYTVSSLNTNFTWILPYDNTFESDIIPLLSLYMKCTFDILCIYKKCDNGKQEVFWKSLSQNTSKEFLRNYELNYINIGESNTLKYFLEHNTFNTKSEKEKHLLSRAIRTYAESKFIPKHIRFITLYSILDKFAGGYGKNTYGEMSKGLKRYNVDIRKIGKSTDSEIRKWNLILERSNNEDKIVHNFCDLRNYIVHFMSNSIIDEYLERKNIVYKIELAVVVILLKELGFTQCNFKKNWEHMSILYNSGFPLCPKCIRSSNRSVSFFNRIVQLFRNICQMNRKL